MLAVPIIIDCKYSLSTVFLNVFKFFWTHIHGNLCKKNKKCKIDSPSNVCLSSFNYLYAFLVYSSESLAECEKRLAPGRCDRSKKIGRAHV